MDVVVCVMLCAAALVRLVLLCFGVYQDHNLKLKYTDVDYHVFTDASRFITQDESPYRRSTFRYTPLLALLLVPNVLVSAHFGKLLFVCCDLLSGLLIFRLLLLRGVSRRSAYVSCGLWLLNPLPIGVSTRGNAESLLAVLVLATLECLELRKRTSAALLFGLSVHMKIYPVTYALPIALSLTRMPSGKMGLIQNLRRFFSMDLLQFAAISASVFFSLGLIFYCIYGWDFLHETYLYHVTRRDLRHNFSPYFYMLYTTAAERGWSSSLSVVCFVPQLLLLLLSSLAFSSDLPFCCFINTAVFVSFNKVCTSQYFLWYLCLLPLVFPGLTLSWTRGLSLVLLWFASQALWLTPAYYLEFEGRNSFSLIWMAGLLFLLINSFILAQIISHYRPVKAKRKKTD